MYINNKNIFSFNSIYGKSLVVGNDESAKKSLLDKMDSIVSASIVEKNSTKTRINIDGGLSLEVDQNLIKGSVGDTILLKVGLDKDNKINLKQIINSENTFSKQLLKQSDINNIKEIMTKSDFIEPEENILKPKPFISNDVDVDEKTREAVRKVKRQLSYSSENITRSAVLKLMSSGVSIDKISLDMLNIVIKEIVDSPQKIDDSEQDKSTRHKVEITMSSKAKKIGSLSNSAIVDLLKNDKDLTIRNVYKAKHSNNQETLIDNEISNNNFEKLLPEVEKIFISEEIEKTESNLDIAKLLVANEVPITKDNISKVIFLQQFANNVLKPTTIENCVNEVINGVDQMDANLFESNSSLNSEYKSIMRAMEDIKPEHIDLYYKHYEKDLNLKDLLKLVSKVTNVDNSTIKENYEGKAITAKRQLEEIRLKLTSESVSKLVKNNIKVDTLSLRQTVEKLRELEQQQYAKYLHNSDVLASNDNLFKMSNLYNNLSAFTPTSFLAYKNIINKEIDFNIQSVSNINKQQLADKYDNAIAEPNRKYNDSFSKVESLFEPLLKSLNIEQSQQNIMAAEILSKNNMEVNEININETKLVNNKINYIAGNLNPYVAADIIKKGYDPSTLNCDEVIEYIDKFNDKYGESTTEKIAEYINEMDSMKFINKEEKNSIIAIYKMLNYIQKDGNASVGMIINSKQNITLGNLLEASKNYSKTKLNKELFDASINDNSEVHVKTNTENSIISTLEKTTNYENSQFDFKKLVEKANPYAIKNIVDNESYNNMTLENLVETLQEIDPSEQMIEKIYDEVSNIKNINPNILQFMTEHNIEFNIKNINAVKEFYKSDKVFEQSLNDIKDLIDSDLYINEYVQTTDLEFMKQGESPNEIINKLDSMLEKTTDITQLSKISKIRDLVPIINSAQTTNSKKIVINFNNSFKELEINILNDNIDNLENSKLFLSLNTEKLGKVDILIKTEKENVNFVIACETQKAIDELEGNKEFLSELISATEYDVGSVKYKLTSAKHEVVYG